MPASVFAIVLFAAALHAGWNTLVKTGGDKTVTTVLVAASAGLIALAALPFFAPPAPASWPFVAASGAIQVVYFLLVAKVYQLGELGHVYPLMRGTAPLIVTVIGVTLLGEPLSPFAATGIFLISAGVFGMALGTGRENLRSAAYALANAAVIAAYTLNDGVGARLSGSPAAYTMWSSILTAIPLVGWLALRRPQALAYALRATPLWRPLAAGAATLLAYALALWAMTIASIPEVAALRETSILFGAAISIVVLKESARPLRLASACVIAAGAAAIRLR